MDEKPEEIIRLADLPRFVGLQRSQIWHYIDKGDFPKPVKLGERAKGWLASEVRAWQIRCIAERDRSE